MQGANCTGSERCNFGTTCINRRCQIFGSIKKANEFVIEDNEIIRNQTLNYSNAASIACETFVAIKTNKIDSVTNLPLYMCISGYDPEFDDFSSERSTFCRYTLNFGNGTKIPGFNSFSSRCGFNRDGKYYCPMRRSEKLHSFENSQDVDTWRNAPTSCHHRSSVQYCYDIESNYPRSSAFKRLMANQWETSDENYALIANSSRCIGATTLTVGEYWRLIDPNPQESPTDNFSKMSY